jgi:inhibitor of KinA sporulation pathway (predicted exonuclease)
MSYASKASAQSAVGAASTATHQQHVAESADGARASCTERKLDFDFLLVLDFEATCQKDERISPQEIIEFPVVLVNAHNGKPEGVFHHYVKPEAHPVLTPFCTELTGITQETVDGGKPFAEVLHLFDKWYHENDLGAKRCAFVTCGDWDLKTCLPGHLAYIKQPIPGYFRQWINLKIAFSNMYGKRATGMTMMLDELGLELQGRHHSGIDDARNIAQVALKMLDEGWSPALTWLSERPRKR